ncbi:uncharacterized protein TRIVIDRAFT_204185 [Trichoderma virens Gv29-8]|uniref:MARVEL domain-containing protein n=1 Tax=Hypocrea virens (strain Gv29-8 / FGSC 10586) TaxID=413071 RepID=G9N386_HYPVG|nr:uncharacterized protein TRIVIDRAFT_204185 [Trichoderma virens Gv29-8]EHK18770.1 hypothetical protein TRIVIDRAFT_204185 [Trichoderma virens Gv29-8]UKZ56552.1 hypothetical protein TrVGV298_010390 [Trichoderma virens]
MPRLKPTSTSRRFHCFSNSLLAYLVPIWSILNFALVLVSTAAWIAARTRILAGPCKNSSYGQAGGCDFTRWGLYFFVSASATISTLTATFMALTSILRPKPSALDPIWVFRGVFFTLIPLMTITWIGWSTPDKPTGILKFPREFDEFVPPRPFQRPLRGIGGGFIFEVMDPWKETLPAFILLHINLFIGAVLAGYSTAVCHPIAPPNTLAHACKDRTSKGLVFLPVA